VNRIGYRTQHRPINYYDGSGSGRGRQTELYLAQFRGYAFAKLHRVRIYRCHYRHTLLHVTSSINRFSILLTLKLSDKFAIKLCLHIPPLLKHVATVPCPISCSKTQCSTNEWTKLPFKTETVEICRKKCSSCDKALFISLITRYPRWSHYKFFDQPYTTVATKKNMPR